MEPHPDFEILEEIGSSGAATVYRARDLNLKRYVAIKELHERLRSDRRQIQFLWEEAQFLAALEHENIIRIYGLDLARGWIIMELMRGGLDASLRAGPLNPDLLRSVLTQMLRGLDFLHGHAKLHGAVKPANLLINDKGRVKLSDTAGLAIGAEVRKPTGQAKYLAPELLDPNLGPIGPGVDLYCAGFTALELLRGPDFDTLFKGVAAYGQSGTNLGWLRLHGSRAEKLPATRDVVPGAPADLSRVIDRLLAKPVNQRYRTAGEALEDLEAKPLVPVEIDMPLVEEPPAVTSRSMQPRLEPVAPPAFPKVEAGCPTDREPLAQAADASSYPRWSRQWINQKLEKPWVLYPLCLAIIAGTALFLWAPWNSTGEPSPAAQHSRAATTPPPSLNGGPSLTKPPSTVVASTSPAPTRSPLSSTTGLPPTIPPSTRPLPATTSPPLTAATKPPVVLTRQLQIKVTPADAAVTVDDKPAKKEANGSYAVAVGERRIRIVAPGYDALERTILVSVDRDPAPLVVALEASKVPVRIRVKAGAVVKVGDQDSAKSDAEGVRFALRPGFYDVSATLAGHLPLQRRIEVKFDSAGQEQEYLFELVSLPPPATQVLLVGVRQPRQDLPVFPLVNADLAALERTFLANGIRRENLEVLRQSPLGSGPGAQPDLARIRQALGTLAKRSTKQDTLLIVLAGHVVGYKGDADAFFLPANADLLDRRSLLSMNELFEEVLKGKAERCIVFVDHVRLPSADAAWPFPEAVQVIPPPMDQLKVPQGVRLLVCSGDGKGFLHLRNRTGVFAQAVLTALRGAADRDGDGAVSLGELEDFVAETTAAYAKRVYGVVQRPEARGTVAHRDAFLTRVHDKWADYRCGMESLAEANYQEAIKTFEKCNRADPQFVDTLLGLVEARLHLSQPPVETILKELNEGIKAAPVEPGFHDFLGDAHVLRGELDEAIRHYSEAIRLDPDYAPTYNSRGLTLAARRKEKDLDAALADYTAAIRLCPVEVRADEQSTPTISAYYLNRALAHHRVADSEAALRDLTQAIERGSLDCMAFFLRGDYRLGGKQLDGAIADLTRSIELNLKDPVRAAGEASKRERDQLLSRTYNLRGVAYSQKSLFTEAVGDFTSAVQLDPAYRMAYLNRASCYRALGEIQKAEADEREAKKLEKPGNPPSPQRSGSASPGSEKPLSLAAADALPNPLACAVGRAGTAACRQALPPVQRGGDPGDGPAVLRPLRRALRPYRHGPGPQGKRALDKRILPGSGSCPAGERIEALSAQGLAPNDSRNFVAASCRTFCSGPTTKRTMRSRSVTIRRSRMRSSLLAGKETTASMPAQLGPETGF